MNRFMDSFQHYNTSGLTKKYNQAASAQWQITDGLSPRATRCVTLGADGGGNEYLGRTFEARDTWTMGVRYLTSDFTSGLLRIFRLFDGVSSGTGTQITLSVSVTGNLQVVRGDGTILATSVGGSLFTNTWFYVEMKVVIHPSAGSVIVKLDNTEVINISGVNTRFTAGSFADSVRLGSGGGSAFTRYCDYYINDSQGSDDTGFWGDTQIDYIIPVSNGDLNQYTPTGSLINFENVDELTADTDDYNSSNTIGNTELYVMDTIAGTPIIKSIQLVALMSKDDGNDRRVELSTKVGATVYSASPLDVPSSSRYLLAQMGVNPATSADWLVATANASQFGLVTEN